MVPKRILEVALEESKDPAWRKNPGDKEHGKNHRGMPGKLADTGLDWYLSSCVA